MQIHIVLFVLCLLSLFSSNVTAMPNGKKCNQGLIGIGAQIAFLPIINLLQQPLTNSYYNNLRKPFNGLWNYRFSRETRFLRNPKEAAYFNFKYMDFAPFQHPAESPQGKKERQIRKELWGLDALKVSGVALELLSPAQKDLLRLAPDLFWHNQQLQQQISLDASLDNPNDDHKPTKVLTLLLNDQRTPFSLQAQETHLFLDLVGVGYHKISNTPCIKMNVQQRLSQIKNFGFTNGLSNSIENLPIQLNYSNLILCQDPLSDGGWEFYHDYQIYPSVYNQMNQQKIVLEQPLSFKDLDIKWDLHLTSHLPNWIDQLMANW